ncbi:hypothetical protein ACEPAG_7526 [Sanghuangporus baumii]
MAYDYDYSHYACVFDDSYTYRSSEAEYPTADAANFYYSASGAPRDEDTGAYGGIAESSGPSSAGPSTAGGLANGMVDNAESTVSIFMETSLLNSYGAGVPAFQNGKLENGQTEIFDPFHYTSSPEDSSSSSSTSRDSSIVNWTNDDIPQQFPDVQGLAFSTEQSFPTLFRDSYLQTRPREFAVSTSSTSTYCLSAGLPAISTTMSSSAPARQISHGRTDSAHSENSIPLSINSFPASANSLSVLRLPGISNKPLQDMSLDSCRDLHMIVNPNITRETRQVQKLVDPNVHTNALLAEPNTGTAQTPTTVNTAPSSLSSASSIITTTMTSALKGKSRRAGPQIRERPFKAKPVSPESKYQCYLCGHSSKLQKDHERHEWRHKRTAEDGWFCPGLTSPWAESCTCPVLGYTRKDLLIRHLRSRDSGSPCYEAAIEMGWAPGKRGSSKVFNGYKPLESRL